MLLHLLLALTSLPAAHAALGEAELRPAVVEYVAARLGLPPAQVEVPWLGLATPLDCPSGSRVEVEADPREDFRGHSELWLRGVAQGQVCDRARVRSQVVVWVSAPVAARSAAPGDRLELREERVRLDSFAGQLVEPGDWEAAGPIQAGQVVTRARVRAVPAVRSGEPVVVVAGQGALLIQAQGRAMQSAGLGETVRVMNLATGTVVVGQVVEPGRVRVGGGS